MFHLNWFSRYRNEIFGLSMIQLFFFHFSEDFTNAVKRGAIAASDVWYGKAAVYFHDYIGSIGVEIFLILSGMGLYYAWHKNSHLSYFYRRRLRRVVVPYLIVAVIFWIIKDLVFHDRGITTFIQDVCFYSFFTKRNVTTIWFIGLIIALYIVFPLIYMRVTDDNDLTALCSTIFLVLCMNVIMELLTKSDHSIANRINIAFTRVPDFAIGVYLGKYIKKDIKIPAPVTAVISAAFIFIGVYGHIYSNGIYNRRFNPLFALGLMMPVLCIINLLKDNNIFRRLFRLTGSYSLELYMCHVTLRNLMRDRGLHLYNPAVFALMLAIAVLLSWLLKKIDQQIPKWA